MNADQNTVQGLMAVSVVALVLGAMASVSVAAPKEVTVSNFAGGDLSGWEEKVFKDKTGYELIKSDEGIVLRADSRASASGLFREMTIDLSETPCLSWSWKVDGILEGLDETTKDGDDYAARVYVIFSGGLLFWNTRALSYVWSGTRPKGSTWPNAYTNKTVMIAAESGPGRVGQWVRQSRNIREDYRRLIGEDIEHADAVAIMTDTDNSGQAASAYYGEVRFTASC